MIKFVLQYIFVFLTGSIMGWCLEVVYRRYFGLARKWINPGFLSGPFLPLYGFALCILYIVSGLNIELWVKVICFALITTGLEYVTGVFFLKVYKTRLWDYSNMKFNFQGIIHPLYTCFWTVLSLFFYYVLYPFFYGNVLFLYEHLEFSLIVGIVLGFVVEDVIQSFDVLNKLRNAAKQVAGTTAVIQYDLLKMEIRDRFENRPVKTSFIHPFRGEFNLKDQVKAHFNPAELKEQFKEQVKEQMEKIDRIDLKEQMKKIDPRKQNTSQEKD